MSFFLRDTQELQDAAKTVLYTITDTKNMRTSRKWSPITQYRHDNRAQTRHRHDTGMTQSTGTSHKSDHKKEIVHATSAHL